MTAGGGAVGAAAVDIAEFAGADGIERHDAKNGVLLGVTARVEIEKEEQLIFQDGAAKIGAKLIANEIWTWHTRGIVEEVVGFGDGVAVVFAGRAVPIVGAALGGDDGGGSAAATIFDGGIGDFGAELLNGVYGDGGDESERLADGKILSINAVDHDIVLVRAGRRPNHLVAIGIVNGGGGLNGGFEA